MSAAGDRERKRRRQQRGNNGRGEPGRGERTGKQIGVKHKKKSLHKRGRFALPLPNLAFPGSATESPSPPRHKLPSQVPATRRAEHPRLKRAGGEKLREAAEELSAPRSRLRHEAGGPGGVAPIPVAAR